MIDSRLATVLIFAILASSVTVIAITALVVGYLEKRNSSVIGRRFDGKSIGTPQENRRSNTEPSRQRDGSGAAK